MHLTRRVRLQLTVFAVITLIAGAIMGFRFLDLPNLWFGLGHYRVSVQLPTSAGLYANGNVTYRGATVGRVVDVGLTDTGVTAVVSLDSNIEIPANLDAQVHSQSAIGENFVELIPRNGNGPALRDGDVIPLDRTQVPPDINALLTATNNGLQAIPHDNLKTAIDEAYTAFGGLGPELSKIVKGTSTLAIDSRKNLDALTTLVDESKPVLDSQTDSSDAIQAWAANLAAVTGQLQTHDGSVKTILRDGAGAFDETRALLDRFNVSVPLLLGNLVSLSDAALVYQPNIEQLLVLLPPAVELVQGATLAQRNTKQDFKGIYLSFNLNLNLPPPCTTGFLPAQQQRSPSDTDYPSRPDGALYCRTPQDGPFNVRGTRNLPCETQPGKRAPTVTMCESDENYIPLNDGFNWKGDPNATSSGQPVPQLPSGQAAPTPQATPAPPQPAAPPPLAVATYDPGTGSYVGPDGRTYTQTNLAQDAQPAQTWQDMLAPSKRP